MIPGRGETPVRVSARRWPGTAMSTGLAITAAGTSLAVSYALQRLLSLYLGEAKFAQVVMTATTPFYWRCAIAAFQAVVVGGIVRFGVDERRAEDVLRFAPIWVPLVVLPLALALVGFP